MALLLVLESSPAMAGRSHTSRRHKQDRDKKAAMDEGEQPSKDKTVARVEVRTAPVSKDSQPMLMEIIQPAEAFVNASLMRSDPAINSPTSTTQLSDVLFKYKPLKPSLNEVQLARQRHQKAAILYFMLTGDWDNDHDIGERILISKSKKKKYDKDHPNPDPCPDLPMTTKCVAISKLKKFLQHKYIPGSVQAGRIFRDRHESPLADNLMADFVAYLFGRPREAVPAQVRDLLRPSTMQDEQWPGSVLPRSVFMPKDRKKGEEYLDQDIRPFKLQNKHSVVEALRMLNESNPFEEMDKTVQGVTVIEEEYSLANAVGAKGIMFVFLTGLGLLVPVAVLWGVSKYLAIVKKQVLKGGRGNWTFKDGERELDPLGVEGYTKIDKTSFWARQDATGIVNNTVHMVQTGFGRMWQAFSNKGLKHPTIVNKFKYMPEPMASSYLGQALPKTKGMGADQPMHNQSGGAHPAPHQPSFDIGPRNTFGGGGFGGPSQVPMQSETSTPHADPSASYNHGLFSAFTSGRQTTSTSANSSQDRFTQAVGGVAQAVATVTPAISASIGLVNSGVKPSGAASSLERIRQLEEENARITRKEEDARKYARMHALQQENDRLKALKAKQIQKMFAHSQHN
eukprot:CAMPEP_0114232134 /NCGR_PEP_ID=MMETSP0058-20121206/4436_1 /TAXON_ID=36894 /ORGANISM="Pyramimonas parkeae, CCMP726" /LENGTH=624 /DNA_ID=CAMNT_0001343571 /DNA_START=21 /DNA_END=1896 /DNA_ORIENTATION=+